jgi:hypothetical protein
VVIQGVVAQRRYFDPGGGGQAYAVHADGEVIVGNACSAKALGITVPPGLLAIADEVSERCPVKAWRDQPAQVRPPYWKRYFVAAQESPCGT